MALGRLFRPSLLANHYPPLHGLRVLGILAIVQIHLGFEAVMRGLLTATHPLYVVTQRLWFSMDLFFVLSGFLIGQLLLAPGGGGGLGRFYARRSFRIVPLYYAVLTLLAVSAPLEPLKRAQLWREYAYLTNYSDTAHVVMFWGWSLCVEEHFYLFVPLLLLGLRKLPGHRSRLGALGLLWASAAVVRLVIAHSLIGATDPTLGFRKVYIPTHTRFDTLIAGVALAYVVRTWPGPLREALGSARVRRSMLAVSAVAFLALLIPPPLPAWVWTGFSLGTVTSVAWAGVILHLLHVPSLTARVLGSRAFLWVATLGYGVYLVHMPVVLTVGLGSMWALRRGGVSPGLAFVVAVVIAFVVALVDAYVLHLLVEKPALWLRDRLAPDPNRAPRPAPPPAP